jgi:hypothetical protein
MHKSTKELNDNNDNDGDESSGSELIDRMSQDAANYVVLYINETSLGRSPHVEINITDTLKFNAIFYSGSDVSLISQEIYNKLISASIQVPVLPVENVVLVTAFGRKSKRIKQQVLIEFTMGGDSFEGVFMIASQLSNDAIIGCQFLQDYGICIDFNKGVISYVKNGIEKGQTFVTEARMSGERSDCKPARGENIPDTNTGH